MGTVVTGRPGKLCYGADCFAAGVEPIRLSAVYSDEKAAALGIQPGSPAYQLTLTAVHGTDWMTGSSDMRDLQHKVARLSRSRLFPGRR